LKDAVNKFQSAIEIDTNYALAYVGLANACRQLDLGYEPGQGWDKRGFEAADKAIQLNRRLPEAYVFRGALFFTPFRIWNAELDVKDQRTALVLNRKVKNAHYNLAFVYNHLGLLDEALKEVSLELEIAPYDLSPVWVRGATLVAQGHYEQGLKDLESIPTEAYPHPRIEGYLKGIALFYLGKTKEAEILLDRFLSTKELADDSLLITVKAMIYAAAGRKAEAEAKINIAEKGEARFVHFHHVAYDIGSAYALMHENKKAMKWLHKAAEEGYPCFPFLKKDPNLDNLRANATFLDFLDEMKKQYDSNSANLLGSGKAEHAER
jgi:tetratricopeptide (TPR) repeat protein